MAVGAGEAVGEEAPLQEIITRPRWIGPAAVGEVVGGVEVVVDPGQVEEVALLALRLEGELVEEAS